MAKINLRTRVSPFRLKIFSLISEIKRIWIRFTCVSLFHYKISLLFFRFFSLIFAPNFSLRFTWVIFASKRNKAKRNYLLVTWRDETSPPYRRVTVTSRHHCGPPLSLVLSILFSLWVSTCCLLENNVHSSLTGKTLNFPFMLSFLHLTSRSGLLLESISSAASTPS
jgi:hypothetical protein